ncbi:MAG TPA: dienelactone hydrolase family protein [Steroidobacteraceae bacterium]|nr:dienelactone hydrolase family protein [Steroidobacteraceae bacterium]
MTSLQLSGCAVHRAFDPYRDLDPGYSASTVQGLNFAHAVVVPAGQHSAPTLWVFLEGDGQPWVDGGRRIAPDPSPKIPLAFDLFTASPVPRAYLGRPCYFRHANDAGCDPSLWTSARYGKAAVASMAAVLQTLIRDNSTRRVILVGYSGGGAIAYLVAPQIPQVAAVVTISGNLDIDAWTRKHGFLPLSESDNPATAPSLDRRITQIAIIGGRDVNVPQSSLREFLDRQRPQELWIYDDHDHACCWRRDWPSILLRIGNRLEGSTPAVRAGPSNAAVVAERSH